MRDSRPQHARITPILTDTHAYACIQKNRNLLKREIFYRKRQLYNNLSHNSIFSYFSCDARDYFRHERYVSTVYYNHYKLNANIIPNHTSHLMIEIKNNVSCPPIFRLWASIFTKSATGMCVYIACMYSAGCAGTFHQAARVHVHRCTRARGSAPSVRARADAWVRATRERCAGRLFRYCCYC